MRSMILTALTLAAAPASATAWHCAGESHMLSFDDQAQTASVQGLTTGGSAFVLTPRNVRAGGLSSGERYAAFGADGPDAWGTRDFGEHAWFEVRFDRVQDRYEMTVRRDDHATGMLEFLPYLTLICDIR